MTDMELLTEKVNAITAFVMADTHQERCKAELMIRDLLSRTSKRAIASVAVQFVEQAWKTLHGADKMQKALETAAALLKKKGIAFDADEMMVLIEAAVSEFNDAFHKPLAGLSTAAAVRRVMDDDREDSGLLDM